MSLAPALVPFYRPIAHRGLHGPLALENTLPAFDAARDAGIAIECDIQRTADDHAVVFHDQTLDRLCARPDRVDEHSLAVLAKIPVGASDTTIPSLATVLGAVAGKVPLVLEIKQSESACNAHWLQRIAVMTSSYQGPVALKSFDIATLRHLRSHGLSGPIGLVCKDIDQLEPDDVRFVDFLSVDIANRANLPIVADANLRAATPILMCWTVRTPTDLQTAMAAGVAPLFEGVAPDMVIRTSAMPGGNHRARPRLENMT